jgi:hypothetical protein
MKHMNELVSDFLRSHILLEETALSLFVPGYGLCKNARIS